MRKRRSALARQGPDDLKSIRGGRLLIRPDRGEEICGGDPAAAIRQLNAAGVRALAEDSIGGEAVQVPAGSLNARVKGSREQDANSRREGEGNNQHAVVIVRVSILHS